MKSSINFVFCFLFLIVSLIVQAQPTVLKGRLIYDGIFKDESYLYGQGEVARQNNVQQMLETAIVNSTTDDWDVNMSDSWSINLPSYSKLPPSINKEAAQKHYMVCKAHIEFYPKSGTAIMNDYLKRAQQSNENEKAIKMELVQKKLSQQEAQAKLQNLDAEIWGAPIHMDIITNDFALSDSAFITIASDENISEQKEIYVKGADYATLSKQKKQGNTFWVTTVYIGKFDKDKKENLQLSQPASLQWKKQNSITIKIYGPGDVALLILNKIDIEKIGTLIN